MPRFLLLLLFAATSAGAATRSIGIVGPAGESTIAYDINAAGQVAAVLEDEDGNQRGVLFQHGKITELGSLGGAFSNTKAINASGAIVGSAQDKGGHWRAFLYQRGQGMRDLGTLGGPSSYGMAINRAADTAGFADTAGGDYHAFFHSDGQMTDLGTLGGKISYASGLNNAGQVVGTAATADGYRHAFVYDAAKGMRDLGTLGGRQSAASAINDAGVIVGASEMPNRRWHAFVVERGKMVDLGALIGYGSSYATAINSAGHVVGTVLIGVERQSFVWRDGKMSVHRGGHSLYLTNAINDGEQVIGATYSRKMDAATMSSAAVPVVARGGKELLALIGVVISLALGAVLHRRRYHGVVLRSFAG